MITIKNQVNNEYNIRASEIKAFSIDGCCIVWENYNEMFKEVDIEVIVKGDTVVYPFACVGYSLHGIMYAVNSSPESIK